MNLKLLRIFPILLLALLCQCGAPQPPHCVRVPAASRVPAATLIATAGKDWSVLATPSRKMEWPAAQAEYNSAVAKLFDQLRCGPGDWNVRAARLDTRIAAPDAWQTDYNKLDAMFPASQVPING